MNFVKNIFYIKKNCVVKSYTSLLFVRMGHYKVMKLLYIVQLSEMNFFLLDDCRTLITTKI